jgi:hypothetical protein
VERRRNAGINRPGVLNNDNAVNAKRITGRDTTVGAAAVTNTATKVINCLLLSKEVNTSKITVVERRKNKKIMMILMIIQRL